LAKLVKSTFYAKSHKILINSLSLTLSLTSIPLLIPTNMKNSKFFKLSIVLFVQLLFVTNIWAQIPTSPNCPGSIGTTFVQINGSNTSTCGSGVVLSAVGVSNVATTDSYVVSSVPYAPFPYVGANSSMGISPITSNLSTLSTVDDIWSFGTPLPFPFCFFGNKYDSLMIGSNGNISFDFATFNPYLITGPITNFNAFAVATPMPFSSPVWNNSINAAYCDLHPQPNTGCSITWQVYGTAPCRAFVVSWDSLPYFSAGSVCSLSRTTAQAVLYENTNIIDLNIKYRQYCPSGTTNLTATQGIQNQAGNKAYTVPGHNASVWTDSTKTWRFTPAGTGANAFTYTWYNVTTGAQVGTGSTVTVNPLDTTKYRVVANFGCSGINITDTFQVNVSDPVIANFVPNIKLGCIDDTVSFTNTSIGANSYAWRFEPGSFSIQTNPTHIYLNQGLYQVVLIASGNGNCKDTIIIPVDLRHPIKADFVALDSLCLANPVSGINYLMSNTSIGGGVTSVFNITNGTNVNVNISNPNLTPTIHTFFAAGTYTVTLIVTDTLGCTNSFSKTVYVDNTPFADFTVTDSTICYGEPTAFLDTIPSFAKSFTWNFGDGFTLSNYHNPQHNYTNLGLQTVTLTADFLICPDYVVSKNINILNYPSVNLGPDTSYCAGLTSNLNIFPLNPSNITNYNWSNGETGPSIIVTTPGTYWLQASNQGCNNADTILVANDCYLVLPNSFTPGSGDGLNNYFMASNDQFRGAAAFAFDVFNRWGEKVFTTTNVNSRGWDGKFGGADQPVGVYVYQISVVFKNGERKAYTGNITLLR
jgi:gliding motility-associated-like protein